MASTEDDLIDLGSDGCAPRIPDSESTLEEQEHLLDVCPPKLEQKLSLTKKQERSINVLDGSDVLVTLGHDQVVPIRKRIDVVSSDTIKRVRDITKNLEPMISLRNRDVESKDTVDRPDSDLELDEETFEAREINNAFNFLSELDDNEDQDYELANEMSITNLSTSSGRPLIDEDELAKTRREFNRASSLDGDFDFDDAIVLEEYGAVSMDNPAFESSPTSILTNERETEVRRSGILKRRSCDDLLSREPKRRSIRRGVDRHSSTDSYELDESSSCRPSTSRSIQSHSSCLVRSESEDESGSDVDWSWLEEVEPSSCSSADATGSGRNLSGERATAMMVGAPTVGARLREDSSVCTSGGQRESCNAGSVAMSVGTTAKSPSSAATSSNHDDHQQQRVRYQDARSLASSWVRASMRRLRHLRLPDTLDEPSSVVISGPDSLPDIALIAPDILAAQTNGSTGNSGNVRPSSAPARNSLGLNNNNNSGGSNPRGTGNSGNGVSRSRCARANRESASRQSSLVSTTTVSDTTTSGTTTTSRSGSTADGSTSTPSSTTANSPQRNAYRRPCVRPRDADRNEDRGEDDDEDENPLGRWPHALSPALACLGCTLGLFNISRFAILSVQFGANFIVQFLVLSLVLGIPIFTLQVCLGQRLTAGSVDMWKISPLFQGVGIALLVAHAFIGVYSIIGISWMFVYFRDSFITKQDRYRWAEPFLLYRDDFRPVSNSSAGGTIYKLYETVPDYFSGAVLQRHHLNEQEPGAVTLKFQVAFNLAVVWMIVFVSLSKGLRSYGKVVYVFTLVPVFGTLVLCTKLLGLTPPGSIHQLFPATVWAEFFINGKSWVAASSEVFLTWGMLGAAAMQIAAHNKHKHLLQRDTSLVVVLTLVVLLLAAFLANTCVQILKHQGYIYTTSSFERISGYTFMRLSNQPAPAGYTNTPERFMSHASFLLGQRVTRPGVDTSVDSGYQVLRLATELVPATLALLGTEQVSPFWAVLFYFNLILFGIAQQLAIWHCVITGIMAINTKMMKLWETTITFFSCACAYILGLPMATELGIYVVYYLDYTIGGAWWIIVLYLVQVGAVFAVRGRPHTGEAVVAELFPPTGRCLRHWAGPLLSFTWNVILPVTLMVLSITIFKSSGFRELYSYRRTNRDYWSIWARQLGASIQLIPILIIPAVAIIQTCRYLNNGPPDIFDSDQVEVSVSHCEQCNGRIQLLYRPSLEPDNSRDGQTQIRDETGTSIHGNGILPSGNNDVPFEDPPPKYTPPPSYTTATGARIAKMLRQSFRRSVRRIANVLGESSAPRQRPALQPPPPDYATVLVEMNQGVCVRDIAIHVTEPRPDVTNTRDVTETRRASTMDRNARSSAHDSRNLERAQSSTLDRAHRIAISASASGSNLTATDVANLLRSSIRRGTARTQATIRRSLGHDDMGSASAGASIENLVEAAAPIGQESLLVLRKDDVALVTNDEHANADVNDDKKTAREMDESVSVI